MDRWKGTPLEDALNGNCLEAAVLLVGAGGRLGELGDPSLMQLLKEAPTPDIVRNTVAELELKVANGFLYADMLDPDEFVNFTRRAVVATLEKAIGLQVRRSVIALMSPLLTPQAVSRLCFEMSPGRQECKVNIHMLMMHRTGVAAQESVERLEEIVKSCDKAFNKTYTHLSKILASDKLDLARNATKDALDGPKLGAGTATVFSNAERDSKMRQLNKFMLQVTHWTLPHSLYLPQHPQQPPPPKAPGVVFLRNHMGE